MAEIKQIQADELRRMKDSEGLIIQGCGGDLNEWVDGINELLTNAGILRDGTRFESVSVFGHDGLTNLLFPFSEDVHIDAERMAVWRLQTHDRFLGTWLSDYVDNRLGGFLEGAAEQKQKPDCPLIGQDGNIFNLVGIASRTLRHSGMAAEAKEMTARVYGSGSYCEALDIIGEYVNITSIDDDEDPDEGESCGMDMMY